MVVSEVLVAMLMPEDCLVVSLRVSFQIHIRLVSRLQRRRLLRLEAPAAMPASVARAVREARLVQRAPLRFSMRAA